MSPRVRHVLGGKRSGTPISNEGSCLPQRAISFGCVFCPRPRSSRVPQHDAITHRPHSTIHVAAAFGTIDAIAVANIETTLPQYRQIACWTNRGKVRGKAGLNCRASIRCATAAIKGVQVAVPSRPRLNSPLIRGSSSSRCGDCCPGGEEGGGWRQFDDHCERQPAR
jgi:hypothetical protein